MNEWTQEFLALSFAKEKSISRQYRGLWKQAETFQHEQEGSRSFHYNFMSLVGNETIAMRAIETQEL